MEFQIDKDIWSINGPEVVFASAPMHTRMTVIRLQDGRLWIHLPIKLTQKVSGFLAELGGSVAALIAPNKYHYMFIEPWRTAFPETRVFAEEHLTRKQPCLASVQILNDSSPSIYAQNIDQIVFRGNNLFQKAVFFHKAHGSLIFTDLMTDLNTKGMKLLPRLFLRFEGISYPNGSIPRVYRCFTQDKAKARDALQRTRWWRP